MTTNLQVVLSACGFDKKVGMIDFAEASNLLCVGCSHAKAFIIFLFVLVLYQKHQTSGKLTFESAFFWSFFFVCQKDLTIRVSPLNMPKRSHYENDCSHYESDSNLTKPLCAKGSFCSLFDSSKQRCLEAAEGKPGNPKRHEFPYVPPFPLRHRSRGVQSSSTLSYRAIRDAAHTLGLK